MSEFDTIETVNTENLESNNFSNNLVTNPINKKDDINNLIQNFDENYQQAIKLMGGDRLLKPSVDNVIIRKTTSQGVYKVLYGSKTEPQVKILDESQLFSNRKFASGSISKLSENEYEIVSFDEDDNMEINHFDKISAIEFLKKNKMTF